MQSKISKSEYKAFSSYVYGKIKTKTNKKTDYARCNKIKQLINFLIVYNYNIEAEAIIINKTYYQMIQSIDSTKLKGFSKAKPSRIYEFLRFWEQNDLIQYDGHTIVISLPKQFVEHSNIVCAKKIETKPKVIKSDVAILNWQIGRDVSTHEYERPVKEFEQYVIDNYGNNVLEKIKLNRRKDYVDVTRNLLDTKSIEEVFAIYNR